jgi:hypothetical protein
MLIARVLKTRRKKSGCLVKIKAKLFSPTQVLLKIPRAKLKSLKAIVSPAIGR